MSDPITDPRVLLRELRQLAETWRTGASRQRGYGSHSFVGAFTNESNADELSAVLDRVDLDRPDTPRPADETAAAIERVAALLPPPDVIAPNRMVRQHRSDGTHQDLFRSDLALVVAAARAGAAPGDDTAAPAHVETHVEYRAVCTDGGFAPVGRVNEVAGLVSIWLAQGRTVCVESCEVTTTRTEWVVVSAEELARAAGEKR